MPAQPPKPHSARLAPASTRSSAQCPATRMQAWWVLSSSSSPIKEKENPVMARITLNVPDIDCEHCEHAITEALSPVAGVRSVQVDIPTKQVRLDYDESAVS